MAGRDGNRCLPRPGQEALSTPHTPGPLHPHPKGGAASRCVDPLWQPALIAPVRPGTEPAAARFLLKADKGDGMSEHDWIPEGEADEKPSRIGWFAAGALAAIALIGLLVTAATVDWSTDPQVADTPPVVIEGY